MSSSSQTMAELEALECHFTWLREITMSELLDMRVKLEDIGTDEGNFWLGPIYNMWGFVLYKLNSREKALPFFSNATETLNQMRKGDEGPWLIVNYGNLAWLHHHLEDEAMCQEYLSKVGDLTSKFPSPSQDKLHPEIYAEKAWSLMFEEKKKQQAADYFQTAFNMQPKMVQWQSSRVIALASAAKHFDREINDDLLQEIRTARAQDPKNLYVAAVELLVRNRKGESVENQAVELGQKILWQPVSSYSGLKPLLRLHRQLGSQVSLDKAISLTEKAMKRHPNQRYLMRCAALCYKWKVLKFGGNQSTFKRAIELHEKVIDLYPETSFVKKADLADILARSSQDRMLADKMYQKLLKTKKLDPANKQLLYYRYATYLHFECQNSDESIHYHMKSANIQPRDFYGKRSVKVLKEVCDRGTDQMCTEITKFLKNLPDNGYD